MSHSFILKKSFSSIKNNLLPLFQKAESLCVQSKLPDSIKVYDQILQIDSSNSVAHYSKASAYFLLKDYKNAEISYKNAILNDETNGNYYICLVNTLKEQGELEKALLVVKSAMDKGVKEVEIYITGGKILSLMGRVSDGIKFFQYAIDIHPQSIKARLNKSINLIELKENEKAIEELDQIKKIDETVLEVYLNKASIYYNTNRTQEALGELGLLLKVSPNYSIGYMNRARILFETRNYEEALKDYEDVIRIEGNNIHALFGKALCMYKIQDYSNKNKEKELEIVGLLEIVIEMERSEGSGKYNDVCMSVIQRIKKNQNLH